MLSTSGLGFELWPNIFVSPHSIYQHIHWELSNYMAGGIVMISSGSKWNIFYVFNFLRFIFNQLLISSSSFPFFPTKDFFYSLSLDAKRWQFLIQLNLTARYRDCFWKAYVTFKLKKKHFFFQYFHSPLFLILYFFYLLLLLLFFQSFFFRFFFL